MIAVNIMSIEAAVLSSDDDLASAYEVILEADADELPVLTGDKLIIGVLSKKRLFGAMKNKAGPAVNSNGRSLNAGGLCSRTFRSASPGATFLELEDMLKKSYDTIYIVDNAGRFLGRVGRAELNGRTAQYGERS